MFHKINIDNISIIFQYIINNIFIHADFSADCSYFVFSLISWVA